MDCILKSICSLLLIILFFGCDQSMRHKLSNSTTVIQPKIKQQEINHQIVLPVLNISKENKIKTDAEIKFSIVIDDIKIPFISYKTNYEYINVDKLYQDVYISQIVKSQIVDYPYYIVKIICDHDNYYCTLSYENEKKLEEWYISRNAKEMFYILNLIDNTTHYFPLKHIKYEYIFHPYWEYDSKHHSPDKKNCKKYKIICEDIKYINMLKEVEELKNQANQNIDNYIKTNLIKNKHENI